MNKYINEKNILQNIVCTLPLEKELIPAVWIVFLIFVIKLVSFLVLVKISILL